MDHLLSDLGQRVVRGGVAKMISQGTQFAVGLRSTMVLARLLMPSDFALLAMVSTLTGLVQKFNDFGLRAAITYQSKLDHIQISKLF